MKDLYIVNSQRMQASHKTSSPELETLIQEFLVLRLIKPGQQIALNCKSVPIDNIIVNGKWVNNKSIVQADIEQCFFDFFKKQVIRFFRGYNFHKDNFDKDNNYIGLNRQSIADCFPLFIQVVFENVKYILPDNCTSFSSCADFCDRSIFEALLSDIIFEKKSKGTFVTKHLKNMKHIPSIMLNIFQKTKNGRYQIINSDINSYEFQIAFLSTFRFTSDQLQYIYELKLNQWISRNL